MVLSLSPCVPLPEGFFGREGGIFLKGLAFFIQLEGLVESPDGVLDPGFLDDAGNPDFRGGNQLDVDVFLA
jgi:hypothetical protein